MLSMQHQYQFLLNLHLLAIHKLYLHTQLSFTEQTTHKVSLQSCFYPNAHNNTHHRPIMSSKAIGSWGTKAKALKSAPTKFTPSVIEGKRLIPTPNKDADMQCRIDAGRYDPNTKKLNVVMQVNSQAKSPVLKDWIKKHSTHGNLATDTFDTSAADKKAEYDRMIDALAKKAKDNLG